MIVEMVLRSNPDFIPLDPPAVKKTGSPRSGGQLFRRLIDEFGDLAVLRFSTFIYPQSVRNVNLTPS